jgi:adenylate cyclase
MADVATRIASVDNELSPAAIRHQFARATFLLDVGVTMSSHASLSEASVALIDLAVAAVDAERGALFLYDEHRRDLFAQVALGERSSRIRFPATEGIAGHVFRTGQGILVDDAYSDRRFNSGVDAQTGFVTRSVLCAPIGRPGAEIRGVVECLNKRHGRFCQDDLDLLQAVCAQAASALRMHQLADKIDENRRREQEFFNLVADITAEIDLNELLGKVMRDATRILHAERSMLFLDAPRTGELWSRLGDGSSAREIRIPNTEGIAGHVFTTGETLNIAHAYADLRFNPELDRQTDFFTRSILCIPIIGKQGRTIGVAQVLNKIGGPFSSEDEQRLRAFAAQVSIALENATMFDEIEAVRSYNECMLQSMSNGVITLDEAGTIVTCNTAGLRIIGRRRTDVLQQPAAKFFRDENAWLLDRVHKVWASNVADVLMDARLCFGRRVVSANLTIQPLLAMERHKIGTMIVIEDITSEKRAKAAMARYMDPWLAEQVLASGDHILGGTSARATMLFADIRGFTNLTQQLGPQGTVNLLNEYFTLMVDCLQSRGGVLDKYIGDAIFATFGIPVAKGDDEDRAVEAAIAMLEALGRWNRSRQENGLPSIDIGIGINSDTVVSGNIGSPKRMDYTVIGDGVNLAARLQEECKRYRTPILISDQTLSRLRGRYRVRPVDIVVARGRCEPVAVHEVLDHYSEEAFPGREEVLRHYRRGVAAFRKRQFRPALSAFERAIARHPHDHVTHLYIERCRTLLSNPPADDWNGIMAPRTPS